MLASISSVAGMSLVGSIFGTVAWYQYSTRATASIMGSDAAVSENLQITLGNGTTGANWKTDLTRNDIYNYMKDPTGTDMAFAVKPCTNVGAEKTENGGDKFVLNKDGALGTFYSHPVYQYADYTQWNTTTSDYIQFDLTLKSNVKGKYTWGDKSLPVYLADLKIVQSGDKTDITDAVRVHFSAKSSKDNSVVNTLVSKNGGDTLTNGKLDLNGDSKDDTPKEKYDFDGEQTALTYGHDGSKQTSYKFETEVKPTVDAKGKLSGGHALGTLYEDSTLTVTVTMWLEGWQKFGTNDQFSSIWDLGHINSDFNVGMTFAVMTLD